MDELWAHQTQALEDIDDAITIGHKRILVTSPTGGGKTRIMAELISASLRVFRKVVLYTNRRMLLDQTSGVMETLSIAHGVRAAGAEGDFGKDFQVSSIQTEHARTKAGKWELHDADLVCIDEAHNQTGPTVQAILAKHLEAGATVVGFTATPIGLGELYDHLIIAGTTSELRKCGALVQAVHYGPDEPDLKGIKLKEGEDPSENDNRKAIMREGIFGRVLEWFEKLNPEHRPTILFAPGVRESLWFAEQFHAAGITAAHLDGEEVWINGERKPTCADARRDVMDASRSHRVTVLCNRFVLREGIDAPWLGHGILATVFGLQSYLQAGGRLLRNPSDGAPVTIQDHGGNWHRHGSLNTDREWLLEFDSGAYTGLRQQRLREKRCRRCKGKLYPGFPMCSSCGFVNDVEAARCPECGAIVFGKKCRCGHEMNWAKRSRPVIQHDGQPKEMVGDIYRPRRISQHPKAAEIWEKMYWRSRTGKGDRTFRAAEALFAYENNWGWPSHDLPLMPTNEYDWFRRVAEVPMERLTGGNRNGDQSKEAPYQAPPAAEAAHDGKPQFSRD